MLVRDCMTPNPWVAYPDQSSLDAAAVMEDRNCGLVPIVRGPDDPTLLGVLTDRDLVLALCRRGCAPGELMLDACFTRNPVTCDPTMPLHEAAARMRRNRVRRLPVCDDAGRLVGILALADLARATLQGDSLSKSDLAEVLGALSR